MEVFIPYHQDDEYMVLQHTLEAWAECEDAEPIAVEIDRKRYNYEIVKRVTADKLAKNKFYILADLGCVPDSNDLIRAISRKLRIEHGCICSSMIVRDDCTAHAAMWGLYPSDAPASDIPLGVRVCEKGAVKRWLPKNTVDYNLEHAASVRGSCKSVEIWPDIFYKHLRAS